MLNEIFQAIVFLRDQFKALEFDFHSCFYYDILQKVYTEGVIGDKGGTFKQHKTFYAFSTNKLSIPPLEALPFNYSLFSVF